MSSIPHTSDTEPEDPENQHSSPGDRPNWLVSLLVVLACLAVVASGWGVARLAVGEPLPLNVSEGPESRPPRTEKPVSDVAPEDAQAYVSLSASLVDGASAFHITFTVYDGEGEPVPETREEQSESTSGEGEYPVTVPAVPVSQAAQAARATQDAYATSGRGHAVYDSGAEPRFEHSFTTSEGENVYRYDVGDGQLMMTADRGLELLDPPSEADRYLCSRAFGSAKLHEVLDTSTDLALVGRKDVELEWPGMRSTHSAYLYTGTFTAGLGGYDTGNGSNTLTSLEEAEFELWIDEQGYPRRLDYRTANGVGASYEYHSFS